MFDALIVGAGPAGSHLAFLLAGEGLRVALMDRDTFPRDKVCGGGLSPKTLDHLGIDLAPVIEQRTTGALITYRNRATIEKAVDPSPGCTVLRRDFDYFLLQRAVAAGARFFPGRAFVDVKTGIDGKAGSETALGHLTVRTSRETLRTAMLFAADGVGSAVRKRVFGKHLVAYVPALEALVKVDESKMDEAAEIFDNRVLFDLGGMQRGYGWIFPKRDHLNVGVYSPFGGQRLREELARFMGCYPLLAQARSVRYQGYAIPLRNRRDEFARGRVWLVGDAAGLAEAVFGEGIYFALKSAALAAQAFKESGFRPEGRRYQKLLGDELLPELRAARIIARMLYAAPRYSFRHLASDPRINDYFAGLITGETGYRECLWRTAASLPRWLFRDSARQAPPAQPFTNSRQPP